MSELSCTRIGRLLLLFGALFLLSGCSQLNHPGSDLVYPDYAPARTEPYSGIAVTAESLSPHRILLRMKNIGEAVWFDGTFALYNDSDQAVPCISIYKEEYGPILFAPNKDLPICIYLGNQYGTLKAGNYTVVKRVFKRLPDESMEICGYIECPVSLPPIPKIHYLAEPMEFLIFYGDGTPICQDINSAATEVSENGAQFTYYNVSENTRYLFLETEIYSLQGDEWLRVHYTKKPGYGLTSVPIEANGEFSRYIDWSPLCGSLPPGSYCLLTLVFDDESNGNAQHLIVQFRIQ